VGDRRWLVGWVVALVAGVGVLWLARSDQPAPVPTVPASMVEAAAVPAPAIERITVHVTGAVGDPGLVSIPAPARVADAVIAAGGATAEADLGGLNLAAPVSDGQLLEVPVLSAAAGGAPGSNGPGSSGGGSEGAQVAINTAGVEELLLLPGVGPVLAERILQHRDRNGLFVEVEDLLDVPGIGEGRLADMRDAIRLP
jgi:competence protein ComEA